MKLLIGASIAVAAGLAAALAWRRSQPIVGTIDTKGWWKFLVAGPAIVVSVIVAAELGVEAWFVGVLAVFVAFVLTLTGVVLGVARWTTRSTRTVPS